MKRVFIVHGWDGRPDEGWQKWLRLELESREFQVFPLAMPESERPVISDWVNCLSEAVEKTDSDTFFVGHSIGCQTIMRYLETVNEKAGGAVFVAGWFNLNNLETDDERRIASPWVTNPIDLEKVKANCPKIVVIFSDNDPFVELESNQKIFKENLDAEIIVKREKEHFTEQENLPEVLEKIIKMAK